MSRSVLILSPRRPETLSGAEVALMNLLSWLRGRGWDARIITAEARPDGGQEGEVRGVPVYYGRQPNMLDWISTFRPAAVLGQLAWIGKPMAGCRARGVATVGLVHMPPDLEEAARYADALSLLLVNSRDLLCRALGSFKASLLLHPTLGDPERWRVQMRLPRPTQTTFALVNYCEGKGGVLFHRLARAFPQERFLGVKGGYGVPRKEPQPPANMIYRDPVERVSSVYAQADIVLMPSVQETFGLVAREALANGLPLVASDLPGIREAVGGDGPAVALLPPHDQPAWEAACRSLLDPERYAEARLDALARAAAWPAEEERQLLAAEEAILSAIALHGGRAEVLARQQEPQPAPVGAAAVASPAGAPRVCSAGAPGQAAVTDALVAELGFQIVRPEVLEQSLASGQRVLVHGWSSQYEPLAVRHPGQIVVLWHSGLSGSELMGEGGHLAAVLRHAKAGRVRLVWLDRRDIAPPGAVHGVPLWSPKLMSAEAAKHAGAERRADAVVVGLHGSISLSPKNSVAAIAGCAGLGELHVGAGLLRPGDPRAGVLLELLAGTRYVVHEPLTREQVFALLARSALLVHPSLSDTWPGLTLEAVYSGCPVVVSDAIAWAGSMAPWARDLCVVRPATSSGEVRRLASHLLASPADRERLAAEQRRAIDALHPIHLAEARRVYESVGLGQRCRTPVGGRDVAPGATPKWPDIPLWPRASGSKPRVLLVADVRGWAFDQNLRDMAAHLGDRFDFAFWYVAEWLADRGNAPDMSCYDAVFTPYHRWPIDHLLPRGRMLGSLRAQWFWPDAPAAPGRMEYDLVNLYRGFHVVTARNFEELRAHCPGAVYLTNPVEHRRFTQTEVDGVVASWNGNAKHFSAGAGVDVKGFSSIVQPACAKAGVPLVVAEYNTSRLAPEQMPAFYRRGSVAVCASLFEGASNSCLEAMASGLALITTDCGNAREMRDSQIEHLGATGIELVERSVPAFVDALRQLRCHPARAREMGRLNRIEIAERWSWDAWADRYADFVGMAL